MAISNERLPPPTAEQYRQYRRKLADAGPTKKPHAPSTKNNIRGLKTRLKKFCELMDEDPLVFLQNCSKEDIMTFLKWLHDNYRIKKLDSSHKYKRIFLMLYRRCVGHSLHAKIASDVNDYINVELKRMYNLDASTREKPVMNVDDIYLILHHHWVVDTAIFGDGRQRVQIALLVLEMAYTATRPAALVYVRRNEKRVKGPCISEDDSDEDEEDNKEKDDGKSDEDSDWDEEHDKTLCYGDVTLLLLPNPDGIRDVLAMEVDVKHTKGHHKKPKRKIFIQYEVNDLIFDTILLMIVLAILDDAFESQIRSIKDIFRLRVRAPRKSLQLRFKKSMLGIPIFRQAVPSVNGVRTSHTKALRYRTFLYYLQRLGMATGFMQILQPYDIRRGTGNELDEVASQATLQQVMNYRDAGIFQAYLNERVRCDVQAAFLGRPSADALIKATSHMSRFVDPRAPVGLTETQTSSLKTHPQLIQHRALRDSLSKTLRDTYGTIKKAKGTQLHDLYRKADLQFQNAKARLRASAKKEARQQFFDSIDTQEVNEQLDPSILGLERKDWIPEMVEHEMIERKHLAEMLCDRTTGLTDEAMLNRRICTI